MTVQFFLTLLLFFSTVSSLITEAVKKQFVVSAPNMVVLVVSYVVGVVGTIIYYFATNTPVTMIDVIYALLMGLAVWVTSMVSYDKVKQTLEQLLP